MNYFKFFVTIFLVLCMAGKVSFAQILSASEIPSDEERLAESITDCP